jgi:hypothetical protein
MLRKILYPIALPITLIRIWKNATPEERAAFKSDATSDEEKGQIVDQIVLRMYPNIVL